MGNPTDSRLKRLYAAANAGDINSLNELLQEDELLLDRAVSTIVPSDNPLHIAAVRGHAGFAKEIVQQNPNLAHELNWQGLSPLHLAAVHGHFHVAEELVQVDADLCYLEDKDGYLPVHIAVNKGRHDLVTLLVGKCEDSVNVPTSFAETLLHLAVKSKHAKIVELLTERGVTQLLLNTKDGNGNTCLHLAFAGRQPKVIKHLLNQAGIDVNPVNSAGLTPLDVLLVTNHEMGDLYLGEMIRAAGGKTAKELQASEINIVNCSSPNDDRKTSQAILLSTPSNKIPRTRSKTNENSKNIENNFIVVATLVATITFAAALNPPGGSIQMPFDDSYRNNTEWFTNWENKNMTTLYPVGSPVYLWHLRKFFMYDYLALFASVTVILLSLPGVITRSNTMRQLLLLVLWSSVYFMVLAFTSALNMLLYKERNFAKFRWLTHVFKAWKILFAGVSGILCYNFLISLIASAAGKVKKWLPSSVSNNVCVPKVKRAIRWAKIKGTISSLLQTAIAILVGFGVGWAIEDMAISANSN